MAKEASMSIRRFPYLAWVLIASVVILITGVCLVQRVTAEVDTNFLYVAPAADCGSVSPCFADLQAAVNAAQYGNVILVAAGTYFPPENAHQLVQINKSLTILGGYTRDNWETGDPLANPTTLDALNKGRVMVISGPILVALDGFHIKNGTAEGLGGYSDGSDAGGGLYIVGAHMRISHCWITDNTATSTGFGGGIYSRGNREQVLISDSVFQLNAASTGGGALLENEDSTLSRNMFDYNTAIDNGQGAGLAIIDGLATVRENQIISNSHGIGAGIYLFGANVQLNDNSIHGNLTFNEGGGVAVSQSTVKMDSNLIQINGATGGAGVIVDDGSTITMTFNTIRLNQATLIGEGADGGGVYLRAYIMGHSFLYGNLIDGNQALAGGGIYIEGDRPVQLNFNRIQNNQASGQGAGLVVDGTNTKLNGNLILNNTGNACVGAGIAIYANATLTNNVVAGNNCPNEYYDSGIYIQGASPRLYHTTIDNNGTSQHIGVYIIKGTQGEPSQPVLYNTIISNQTWGVFIDADSPSSQAILDGILWWQDYNQSFGNLTITHEVTGDPLFVNATSDYHISAGSAAIDQGVPTGVARDMDNQPRRHIPDLGADEYWAPGELLQIFLTTVVR
jgi:hypothetical protein